MKIDKSIVLQNIYDDYIEGNQYIENRDVMNKLQLLIDNDLGWKMKGTDVIDKIVTNRCRDYFIICKFLNKYAPDYISNNRINLDDISYHNDLLIERSDINSKFTELNNYILPAGNHIIEPESDEHKYIYFILTSDVIVDEYGESDEYKYEFYIIGSDYKKYKDKFTKFIKKYKELEKNYSNGKHQWIRNENGTNNIKFKTFDQLFFDDKENVISYINKWKSSIPMYEKYSMIPKLSILLYGDPGTGKSTFYQALADYLDIDYIEVINPKHFSIDQESTSDKHHKIVYASQNENAIYRSEKIYAIDEIDMVASSRENKEDMVNNHTLSNLLSFLDNPPSFFFKCDDGKFYRVSIVVATTNYIDRLDPAVKRFGRFDLKIHMKDFNKKCAEQMCEMYNVKLEDVVGKIDKNFSISPAELQAICLNNIENKLRINNDGLQ